MRPVILAALLCCLAGQAGAAVLARVDNGRQSMQVFVDGRLAAIWPVSTARPGFRTPRGTFRVQRMERIWYSRKYDMAPMPYALFFLGGYAVHGTGSIRQLGRPASHGCVRLAPASARALFALAQRHGGATIQVVD